MLRVLVVGLCLFVCQLHADGPSDNVPDNVRSIPPKGSDIPADVQRELRAGLTELQAAIAQAEKAIAGKTRLLELLPDVLIYEKAVRWALDYNEMYLDEKSKRNDADVAKVLLKKGMERAKELAEGEPSWITAKGLVVRGYRSKIDGSVQPYGLVIPDNYDFKDTDVLNSRNKHRLDVWWHGRYENNLELSFIAERQRNRGEFSQAGVITVHPFGRFSNANKFAGEVDTFEVLYHVMKNYRIDDDRIVARGFSMGGAACWQYAVHYPMFFCAAAPGAGFAETKEFLGNFQNEKVKPEWWEKKLWRMYDATEYAGNLFNIPTIAYSGENDKQKQAADIMTKYATAAGVEFPHIIGKGAGHNYTLDAKKEINAWIDNQVQVPRNRNPNQIRFTTYTLKYNALNWVKILGLEKHWERAHIEAIDSGGTFTFNTSGITKFRMGNRRWPQPHELNKVIIDGQEMPELKAAFIHAGDSGQPAGFGRVLETYRKVEGQWVAGKMADVGLAKTPGLQGPIDDAFMDSFLMVSPTGKPMNEKLGTWVEAEMKHATTQWRRQFRGDAPIKKDSEITDADIANYNLILWGDAKSNAVLAKIAAKLPLMNTFGDTTIPAMIYPNPLNPKKYVVLNSGFTYREYDYLNNARQVSKLPDYAVIDVTTPPNSRFPGKIVRAGFFDELWKLQANDGKD